MSDYRTGRSYVMFNYNNIGWRRYRPVAQGYRFDREYRQLFTSYSSLSYQLPTLIGNTGKTIIQVKTGSEPALLSEAVVAFSL